jgi:hypothetical protein
MATDTGWAGMADSSDFLPKWLWWSARSAGIVAPLHFHRKDFHHARPSATAARPHIADGLRPLRRNPLWERLAPARSLPQVRGWRTRGVVAFGAYFFASSYLPLLWNQPMPAKRNGGRATAFASGCLNSFGHFAGNGRKYCGRCSSLGIGDGVRR